MEMMVSSLALEVSPSVGAWDIGLYSELAHAVSRLSNSLFLRLRKAVGKIKVET